jgi:hypothetical protein
MFTARYGLDIYIQFSLTSPFTPLHNATNHHSSDKHQSLHHQTPAQYALHNTTQTATNCTHNSTTNKHSISDIISKMFSVCLVAHWDQPGAFEMIRELNSLANILMSKFMPAEVYASQHLRMSRCTHAKIYAHGKVRTSKCMESETYTHWNLSMTKFTHVKMYACRSLGMSKCMHAETYAFRNVCTFKCTHIRMYAHRNNSGAFRESSCYCDGRKFGPSW